MNFVLSLGFLIGLSHGAVAADLNTIDKDCAIQIPNELQDNSEFLQNTMKAGLLPISEAQAKSGNFIAPYVYVSQDTISLASQVSGSVHQNAPGGNLIYDRSNNILWARPKSSTIASCLYLKQRLDAFRSDCQINILHPEHGFGQSTIILDNLIQNGFYPQVNVNAQVGLNLDFFEVALYHHRMSARILDNIPLPLAVASFVGGDDDVSSPEEAALVILSQLGNCLSVNGKAPH